ncbi:hypothetical protein SRB17_78260 [Streptomyces sp. RB17]|uniref:hypothetical protein n=1 Tax=Streptomyces sp. RB17 TaxID=2585197 RepID=UPI0012971202|nr:hypothetical protein [Streptomyces sp. RB17]MQY39798.1 hypothetical protein [Streptomyces sp. RB17]
MDDEQVCIEAELGELTPAEVPQWGGLLRGVPEQTVAAMRRGDEARLSWPDGQERSVRLAGVLQMDDQGRLLVAILGEGTPPAE